MEITAAVKGWELVCAEGGGGGGSLERSVHLAKVAFLLQSAAWNT